MTWMCFSTPYRIVKAQIEDKEQLKRAGPVVCLVWKYCENIREIPNRNIKISCCNLGFGEGVPKHGHSIVGVGNIEVWRKRRYDRGPKGLQPCYIFLGFGS